MKIPLDTSSLDSKDTTLDNQRKELLDDASLLNALSEQEFYSYINDNISKVIENPRNRTRLINFLNKVDDLLEKNINEYKALVCDTPSVLSTHKEEIDKYHRNLNNIFAGLFRVLNTKVNISKFQSMEHLIRLVPVCLDFPIIRKCIHIIFSKFSDEDLTPNDYSHLEASLPRLAQNINHLFQHYNLASFYSRPLMDLFQDDSRYENYLDKCQPGEKGANKLVPEYSNELVFEVYKDGTGEEAQGSSQNNVLSLRIPNLQEKYANESHIYACKKINEEYNLGLKEDTLLWDTLAFKIRACMQGASLSYRAHAISVAIDALKVLIGLRKMFNSQDKLKKYVQHLPAVFDFTSFLTSSFGLFYLQVIPDLHESIITCISSLLAMMDSEQEEFKDFSQQIVTQYQLFQKILKDCTTLQVSFDTGKPEIVTTPSLIPRETASNQNFLGSLLYLLHIGINHSFIDTESNFPTNQIYSITGIVSSLLNVLKPPVNGYFLYNIESLTITLDTIWMILPNQNFINDFNIMDKLVERVYVDLELLLDKDKKYYHLCEDEWRLVNKEEHFEVIQTLLKLLDSPFEHPTSSRVQMAPTMARKIGEGNLIGQFSKVIEADVINNNIFMAILLLVSDIARELPNFVDNFIDQGIIKVIFEKLQKPFARDFPHIHLIIYFVNMVGLSKKGFELERGYKILEKLFDMLTDWNQADNSIFNELISDLAKELSELIKSLEIYREIIADLVIQSMQKMGEMEDKFLQSCMDRLKGKSKSKIGIEQNEKMQVEEQKPAAAATEEKEMQILAFKEQESSEEKKPEGVDLLMNKKELQEFEKDLGRMSILVQNNCNIFSRALASEYKMREIMHKKNAFDYMFKIISFPLLALAEISPITWASSFFKHMANKISGTEHDVQRKIYNFLMAELDGVEALVGKLGAIKDFSKVLDDDICFDARINGLYFIINKYKERSVDTIQLMGRLSYIELLVDFLRYHETFKISVDESFTLVDRLANLFVLILNQIKREDANYVKRNLEITKKDWDSLSEEKIKDTVDKCKRTISESHASHQFTYHHTLRKFFKKVLAAAYDYECAEKYAKISLKILEQMSTQELRLDDEKETDNALYVLSTNNSMFSYLYEFFSSTNYKRFRVHPELFFTFYRGYGFHTIIDILNQLRGFTEAHHSLFQEPASMSSINKAKLILIKESLSQNYLKLSLILKMTMLMPIQPNEQAKIDGLVQREAAIKKEYFLGACKDIIDKFLGAFMGIGKAFEAFYLYHIKRKIAKQKEKAEKTKQEDKDNKEKSTFGSVDNFYENMGSLLDSAFECIKRIQSISKDTNTDERPLFGERNPRETYISDIVLRDLIDMGFQRERAELAVRNAEMLSVESALSWLEAYEQAERAREGQIIQNNKITVETKQIVEEEKAGEEREPMEQEPVAGGEDSGKRVVVRKKQKEISWKDMKKMTKEEFLNEVVNKSLRDLSKHIIVNIFFFEGYDNRVLEIIQYSLDTQEGDAKKLMAQEIAVIIYKLLKHNVNNFSKGVEFLSKFKVSKSFEKSIILTKESLNKMPTQKVSILSKLRTINNILPWFNHFLNYIPNIEKNLLKSDFVTELLRFFEQMLKELDDAKESAEDQEILYEISNSLTEKFFQTLFAVLKLKNSLQDHKKDQKVEKGEKATKEDNKMVTESQPANASGDNSQMPVEKEDKPSQIQQTKMSTKEGEKEPQAAATGQEPAKKGIIELMISILNQAEQFSLKHKRSVIFYKNSLCLYMKVLNLLLVNNHDNIKAFIDNKGLQELLKYKLDSREPKGVDFLKEFSDMCLTLISEPALNIVSLECKIKTFFYNLQEKRCKLRTFTDKFKEEHSKDQETFMAITKLICSIEDKEKERQREKLKRTETKALRNKEKDQEEGKEPQQQEGQEPLRRQDQPPPEEEKVQNIPPERDLFRKRGRGGEDNSRYRKQEIMISLKPDIEFSRLYSLGYLAQQGEKIKGYQPNYNLKKRKRSGKIDDMKDEDVSNHVLDFMPPGNSQYVVHGLLDTLVQQFNTEINEEAEKGKNEKGETQFYPIFSYSLILLTFQLILNKHPILSQPVLRQNVTKSCKSTLKNPAVLKNLDLGRNISFLTYFLRVLVFSTMDLFRSFFLSICSNTSLVVDKDRNGNAYPTPYFFDLKKKIVSEIFQILDEEVIAKPFHKTKEDSRLFCSVSGLFFYLLPLKDIAKLVFDNMGQHNFLKVYAEASKQLKLGNYEHLEKLNVFVSEPFSVLVQCYHYFVINKENQEDANPGDIWLPKKALGTNTFFTKGWKKLINPASRGGGDNLGGTRIFRLPQDDDQDDDDMSDDEDDGLHLGDDLGDDDMDDMDNDDEDEDMGEDDEEDDEEGQENEEEGEGAGEEIMQNEGSEQDQEDDWTDVDEDDEDEDEGGEGEGEDEEDDDEDGDGEDRDNNEDREMYGEHEGEEDIMDNMESSIDDEEGEDDDNEEDDDVSDEYYDDSEGDEDSNHPINIGVFIETGNNRRSMFPGLLNQNNTDNSALVSQITVQHYDHPEIQRINEIMQSTSVHFDRDEPRSLEDQAQPQNQQPGGEAQEPQASEPLTVFDRIHDRVMYLQSVQYLEDNTVRRSEFHENFFGNPQGLNLGEDSTQEGGIRAFRALRDFLERPARNNHSLNILDDLFLSTGRGPRGRPFGMMFQPRGGEMRIEPLGLPRPPAVQPLYREPRLSNNDLLENLETQLLNELAPNIAERNQEATAAVQNVSNLAARPDEAAAHDIAQVEDQEPNPFEELRTTMESLARRVEREQAETSREEREETKEGQSISKSPVRRQEPVQEENKREAEESKEGVRSSINFEEFGLDPDFLERNGIDPTFFNELDDELKFEIMQSYMNRGPGGDRNRNSDNKKPKETQSQLQPQPQPQAQAQAQAQAAAAFTNTANAANNNTLLANEFLSALATTRANLNMQEEGGMQQGGQTQPSGLGGQNTVNNSSNISAADVSNAIQNILANIGGGNNNAAQSQVNQLPATTAAAVGTEAEANQAPANTGNTGDNAGNNQNNQQGERQNLNAGNELMNTALETAAFFASLAPDLRADLLRTADPTILASLPPEMVAEAEALREEREAAFDPYGLQERFVLEDELPNPYSHNRLFNRLRNAHAGHRARKPHNFLKEALSKDKSLIGKLYAPDEKTIESILKFIYMSDESFGRFPFNLLKSLMLHPQTENKVLDCLFYLLKNPDLGSKLRDDEFPCKVIYEKNSIEKNYRIVYEKISLKILFLLEQFTMAENLQYFVTPSLCNEEGENQEKSKRKEKRRSLQSLTLIRESNKERSYPLLDLIRLLNRSVISNSAPHMKLLLNTINNITRSLKANIRPKETEEGMKEEKGTQQGETVDAGKFKIDREHVKTLIECFSNSVLEEDSLHKVSNVICILCLDRHNFGLFIQELNGFISNCAQDANKMLTDKMRVMKNMMSQDQEMQIQERKEDVMGLPTINNHNKEQVMTSLLNRLDVESDYEIRLHKILGLVQELFERSLIEFSKKSKKSGGEEEISNVKDGETLDTQSKEKVKDFFRNLFEDEQLKSLWINITEFLSTLNEIFVNNWAILSPISHKLQPVLESFFIIYKILNDDEAFEVHRKGKKLIKAQDNKKQASFEISRIISDGEAPKSPRILDKSFQGIRQTHLDSNDMLMLMCEKNKNILNMMVKQDPSLLSGSLSVVVKKMSKILEFENKRTYFKNELRKLRRGFHNPIRIRVSRNNLFMESFNQIIRRKPHEMKGKIVVEFEGEEGIDAGGVTREWYLTLSREILNPNYALFKPAAHGSAFQPSPQSHINNEHLNYFQFVGRIIGKALHDGYMLDCYFTRSFYKHILGQPLTYHDIEDIDPEYYKNLTWILENDISGLDLTFSYEADEFGQIKIIDLMENGRNIPVTEQNKREYVQKICYAKMANDIKEQIEYFLKGFHDVIPHHLIQIFDSRELELMISGLPDIDIKDLKENTDYHNYTKDSEVIEWLWEILESLERTQKAAFLQFVTGTSKVPIGGFKNLVGMGGALQKFQIHKSFDTSKLPTSHTCFNQLDLPEYRTKDLLKEKLMLAITEGKEGFGFV